MADQDILVQILAELKSLCEGQSRLEVRMDKLETNVAEFRTELKADIADVRTELKADITEASAKLKAELQADIAAASAKLKAELQADIASVQEDVRQTRVLVEYDVRRDITLIAEQHGAIIAQLRKTDEIDDLKDRVCTLERVTTTHTEDIARLKKAQ